MAVILESVAGIRQEYGHLLRVVEWAFTIAFTIEYVLRLIAVDRPGRYATSFFGVVDLLAILPTSRSWCRTPSRSWSSVPSASCACSAC